MAWDIDQLENQVAWSPSHPPHPFPRRSPMTGCNRFPDTCKGHQLALPYIIIIGMLHVLGSHNIFAPVCPKSLIAIDRLRINERVRARFAWVARRFALLALKWI